MIDGQQKTNQTKTKSTDNQIITDLVTVERQIPQKKHFAPKAKNIFSDLKFKKLTQPYFEMVYRGRGFEHYILIAITLPNHHSSSAPIHPTYTPTSPQISQ